MTVSNGSSKGMSIKVDNARIIQLAYLLRVEWPKEIIECIDKGETFDVVDKIFNPSVLVLILDDIGECNVVCLDDNWSIRSMGAVDYISIRRKYIENLQSDEILKNSKQRG